VSTLFLIFLLAYYISITLTTTLETQKYIFQHLRSIYFATFTHTDTDTQTHTHTHTQTQTHTDTHTHTHRHTHTDTQTQTHTHTHTHTHTQTHTHTHTHTHNNGLVTESPALVDDTMMQFGPEKSIH